MDILTVVVNILISASAAILSAYLAVRFAIKRFRAEQWWARKADTYERTLRSLYDAKRYESLSYRKLIERIPVSKEREGELADKASSAMDCLRRTTATGEFILCGEASVCLQALWDSLSQAPENRDDEEERLGLRIAALRECLKKLPEIAKRDLKVT